MDEYIDLQKAAFPQLSAEFDNLGSLCAKKLWHQLSLALEDFLNKNKIHNWNVDALKLYNEFIFGIESRLSPVRLAIIVSSIGHTLSSPAEQVAFFERMLQSKSKLGDEASLYVSLDVALAKLSLGAKEDAKVLLEEGKEKLQAISSNEAIVFSKFYFTACQYRKVAGPAQEFYKAALMYLAYTPVEDMDPQTRFEFATDIALAAATGEGIYNFGEVLATPILLTLKDTPNEWLLNLILLLNAGDIDGFNSLVDRERSAYFAQPALAAMHEDVKKKLVFLCLLNIVFERHSHDRTISFQCIASRTRLPLDQVEWVLMRALSLGLIKGVMDEVEGVVEATWVQPRVLDAQQLCLLAAQMEVWADKVKSALVTVEEQTPELYV